MPENELPPLEERELRAKWFSTLSDAERDSMVQQPFALIEEMYAAWRAQHEPSGARRLKSTRRSPQP